MSEAFGHDVTLQVIVQPRRRLPGLRSVILSMVPEMRWDDGALVAVLPLSQLTPVDGHEGVASRLRRLDLPDARFVAGRTQGVSLPGTLTVLGRDHALRLQLRDLGRARIASISLSSAALGLPTYTGRSGLFATADAVSIEVHTTWGARGEDWVAKVRP